MSKTYSIAKTIIELGYPTFISIIFTLIVESAGNKGNTDALLYSFNGLFYLILFSEWIRRKQDVGSKIKYEKYIWLILIIVFFILGIYCLSILPNKPRSINDIY